MRYAVNIVRLRLRDASRLAARTIPETAWEFHAACEGLAALELRCTIRPTP